MRRARFITSLTLFMGALLMIAPAALARGDAGQGFYGESTDKAITDVMFITIAFFPTVITVFSLVQWRLDKRKHARQDAAKRRQANVDWRGGW